MARIFITGSTDGLGNAAARTLLDERHDVVLHARTAERADAVRDLATHVVIGDLASAAETRHVAEQVNALGRMDAVIHNAGIYTSSGRNPTPEGHPSILAINTLAPYLLTALIERPARLVYLSSGLHRDGEGSLDDFAWLDRKWDTARAYAESKLHVAALAAALAQRWPEVVSSAVDPGWVRTRMGGPSAPVDLDTGQRTQSWLASTNEGAAQVRGRYWHHMREEQPAGEVTDTVFQQRLLERLKDLTGVALP